MGRYNLKLEIDVVNLYREFENDSRKRKAVAPILSNSSFRREFGRRVIDRIRERTQDGMDKNGRNFKAYSKSYKNSLTFEIYGKTNKVDLTLTGEMLASLDVGSVPPRKVVIDFASGVQEAKAHGHIFGGGYKGTLPVRDFFGLPRKDQFELMQETLRDYNADNTDFNVPTVGPDTTTTDDEVIFEL